MRWLWSPTAIKCHLVFGASGAIFVMCLFDKVQFQKTFPGNDWIWFLLFLGLGYPGVLFLLWFQQRNENRMMAREVEEAFTEPDKVRRRRTISRHASLVFILVLGCAAIYFGRCGWLINGLPAEYCGYFLLGFAALGTWGVNIWYGGPIDPRFDPQDSENT